MTADLPDTPTPAASSPPSAERIAQLERERDEAREELEHMRGYLRHAEKENTALKTLCAEEAENVRTHVFQTDLDGIERRLRNAADGLDKWSCPYLRTGGASPYCEQAVEMEEQRDAERAALRRIAEAAREYVNHVAKQEVETNGQRWREMAERTPELREALRRAVGEWERVGKTQGRPVSG
jgi:chromosome segregation ATPase